MNAYFLVEGRNSERKLYPCWLQHSLPNLKRVKIPSEAKSNSNFLISGEGYPSILKVHLRNAITDILKYPNYDFLVVVLDAEESSVEDRRTEVINALEAHSPDFDINKLRIIVQNRCIETWLLGNRRIVSRAIQDQKLLQYMQFYNVISSDPERMPLHSNFNSHGQFHFKYLRLIFQEKHLNYSKKNPGHASDNSYLEQLYARIHSDPDHLKSFMDFSYLIAEMKALLK